MPQIGWFEILIVVLLAILIIGPKDFPIVIRKIGNWTSSVKKYFVDIQKDFSDIENVVESFFNNHPESWPCWAFSNHDSKRIASRINQDPKTIMKKLLKLKGNVCIYQGEELGLSESEVEYQHIQDPFGKNFWPEFKGRDGCRVPIPWYSKSKNFGFSNSETWLPVEKKYKNLCVDIQQQDSNSMLNFTKEQIALRKKIAT